MKNIDLTGYEEVKGFPGYYINKEGLVWSSLSGKHIGTPVTSSNGRYSTKERKVNLYKDGKVYCHHVFRLIWKQFVGEISNVESIINKPGKEGSTRLEDLRLVSRAMKGAVNGVNNGVETFRPIHVKNLKTGVKATFLLVKDFLKTIDMTVIKYNNISTNRNEKFLRIGEYMFLNPFHEDSYGIASVKDIDWPEVYEVRDLRKNRDKKV